MAEAFLTPEDLVRITGKSIFWVRDHSGLKGARPRIPAFKIGRAWRYSPAAIKTWAAELEAAGATK